MNTIPTDEPAQDAATDPEALVLERWGTLLDRASVLRLLDKEGKYADLELCKPGRVDPDPSATESAGGWGERLAELAAKVAAAHAAGEPPRALYDLAEEGARYVDCPDCGARGHRAQCGPHGSYHLLRFFTAYTCGLITLHEFAAVLWTASAVQDNPVNLVRVRDLMIITALKRAALAAEAAGDGNGSAIGYHIVAEDIRYRRSRASDRTSAS